MALWFPVLWLIVALIALGTFIRRRTIEIAITNQRLIYRHGWIARKTEEADLRRIAEIDLEQRSMGRIFGFGKVLCRGVGSGGVNLPPIDRWTFAERCKRPKQG